MPLGTRDGSRVCRYRAEESTTLLCRLCPWAVFLTCIEWTPLCWRRVVGRAFLADDPCDLRDSWHSPGTVRPPLCPILLAYYLQALFPGKPVFLRLTPPCARDRVRRFFNLAAPATVGTHPRRTLLLRWLRSHALHPCAFVGSSTSTCFNSAATVGLHRLAPFFCGGSGSTPSNPAHYCADLRLRPRRSFSFHGHTPAPILRPSCQHSLSTSRTKVLRHLSLPRYAPTSTSGRRRALPQ